MATMGALSKVRGTTKSSPYPQTEGLLGETMFKYGRALGDESCFGKSLVDASESFKQLADIKYALEDTVKQGFLDPLTHLQNSDLKDCMVRRLLDLTRCSYEFVSASSHQIKGPPTRLRL
jgi:endophilin-A